MMVTLKCTHKNGTIKKHLIRLPETKLEGEGLMKGKILGKKISIDSDENQEVHVNIVETRSRTKASNKDTSSSKKRPIEDENSDSEFIPENEVKKSKHHK